MHTFPCSDQHFGSNQKQAVPLPTLCTTHPIQHVHTAETCLGSVHFTVFAVFLMAYGVTGSGHTAELTALPWENLPLQTPQPADLPFAPLFPQALTELPRASHNISVLSNPSFPEAPASEPVYPNLCSLCNDKDPDYRHTHWESQQWTQEGLKLCIVRMSTEFWRVGISRWTEGSGGRRDRLSHTTLFL